MSELLIPCRRCGRQVSSRRVRDGVCADCRVEVGLADLRRELARLWRKRERYGARGANLASIDRQLERVQGQVAQRIVHLLPEESGDWEAQFEATLSRARGERYDLGSLRRAR